MTLSEFYSWQAYATAKAKAQSAPVDKGADLPALGDLPPAAIGRAIGGR
jgi:hypothetical protein